MPSFDGENKISGKWAMWVIGLVNVHDGEGTAQRSFFIHDTATTENYTLSLHDALPIACRGRGRGRAPERGRLRPRARELGARARGRLGRDRKSTRLNSSHVEISYAVFCLKKKKKTKLINIQKKKINSIQR